MARAIMLTSEQCLNGQGSPLNSGFWGLGPRTLMVNWLLDNCYYICDNMDNAYTIFYDLTSNTVLEKSRLSPIGDKVGLLHAICNQLCLARDVTRTE
jgi:hypothetical protein